MDFQRQTSPPEDVRKRIKYWKTLKGLMTNQSIHISRTRIVIRNIPKEFDERKISWIVIRSFGRINESEARAMFDPSDKNYEYKVLMRLLKSVGCTEMRFRRGQRHIILLSLWMTLTTKRDTWTASTVGSALLSLQATRVHSGVFWPSTTIHEASTETAVQSANLQRRMYARFTIGLSATRHGAATKITVLRTEIIEGLRNDEIGTSIQMTGLVGSFKRVTRSKVLILRNRRRS